MTVKKTPAAAADTKGNGVDPATEIDTSGAPQQVVPDVDLDHPAVDADPRSNTSAEQNRIDFNDPSREGVDVVTEQLKSTSDQ